MFGIGVLGKILGSEKAFGKVFDAAKGAIDKAVYTKQEKAEHSEKLELMRFEQHAKLADQAVKWMEATSGQNITRRILAIMIFGIWFLSYFVALVMSVASVFVKVTAATQLRTAAAMLNDHISDIEGILMLVAVFYFGSPHVQGVVDVLTKRMGSKPTSGADEELRRRETQRIIAAADRPVVDDAEIERRVQQGVDERVKLQREQDRAKAVPQVKPPKAEYRSNPARDRLLGLS